jgi:hypothetical protein
MIECQYTRVAGSTVLAGMLAEILINILTVLFSGVELCNAIDVPYLFFVALIAVTSALLGFHLCSVE